MSHSRSVFGELEELMADVSSLPEFADVEVLKSVVRRERGAYVLAFVVDRAGGVDTNLCEAISRQLIRRADALSTPIDYRVEVSSAGLERPLLDESHYRRFAGRVAKVITTLRIANRTEFTGEIRLVTADAVTIADPHAGPTPIPYAAIKRAFLTYDPKQDLKKKR